MNSKISMATQAAIATAIPTIAFAQSATPTFLHENRMGIAITVCLYLAPSIIAFYRKHRSIGAIIAINILLGWTVIGWLWAFIKALGATKTDVVIVNPSPIAVTTQTVLRPCPRQIRLFQIALPNSNRCWMQGQFRNRSSSFLRPMP